MNPSDYFVTTGMGGGGSRGNSAPNNKEESGIKNKITRGKSKAPKEGEPDSIYEQLDDKGNIMPKTKYDKNGKVEYREDYTGKAHYDKDTKQYLKPHRHIYEYNDKGQSIGNKVIPVPK